MNTNFWLSESVKLDFGPLADDTRTHTKRTHIIYTALSRGLETMQRAESVTCVFVCVRRIISKKSQVLVGDAFTLKCTMFS